MIEPDKAKKLGKRVGMVMCLLSIDTIREKDCKLGTHVCLKWTD
ncbi:hypothetical protein ES703_24967 [subsurface metagenome]